MDIMMAIADPVRREILEMLNGNPLSAGDIASRFTISRPAISRHLRILQEVGLLTVASIGRERIYSLEPSRFGEVDAWLAQFRDRWASRFDALETEVFRTRRERERAEAAHPVSTPTTTAITPNPEEQSA